MAFQFTEARRAALLEASRRSALCGNRKKPASLYERFWRLEQAKKTMRTWQGSIAMDNKERRIANMDTYSQKKIHIADQTIHQLETVEFAETGGC